MGRMCTLHIQQLFIAVLLFMVVHLGSSNKFANSVRSDRTGRVVQSQSRFEKITQPDTYSDTTGRE